MPVVKELPTWADIKSAYESVSYAYRHAILVGTAGLWALGFKVFPADIDFLVERKVVTLFGPNEYPSTIVFQAGEFRVDCIQADNTRVKYLTKEPIWINDVPVADLSDILGLKHRANRPKDHDFLEVFCAELAKTA